MEPIVKEILDALKMWNEKYLEFEEMGDNRFVVKLEINEELGWETFFNFDVCGDTVRFEVKHLFGILDRVHDNEYADVLDILMENNDSFGGTSAYLALIENNGNYFASLQSSRAFLVKWDPDDIAMMIDLAHCDIMMSTYFLIGKPVVPAIKIFGPSEQQ